MPTIETTDRHIQDVYELLGKYRPNKKNAVEKLDAAIQELVRDKVVYQTNIDTLYYKRSFIKKILYFFGFFITAEEKKQMGCIKRINNTVDFAIAKKENYRPSHTERVKEQLRQYYSEKIKEKNFRELLAFSLQEDPTDAEIQLVNDKLDGVEVHVADFYFGRILADFLKQSHLDANDAAKLAKVVNAFTFNENISWKAVKHGKVGQYYEKAVERLHKSLSRMKPGDEIVFSGNSSEKRDGKVEGHGVLFSCMMIDANTFCVRVYDTSSFLGGTNGSIRGVLSTAWDILCGRDADISLRRNFKIAVQQSFFHKSALESNAFAKIFTEEIVIFDHLSPDMFARYKKFVETNQIFPTDPNLPKTPQIKFQQGPNCAISSKLAYLEETLGSELFTRFKEFIRANLR